MSYQNFSREDFVADSYFRKWVRQPDAATREFWSEFLTDYPEQTETIRQAAELVLQLSEIAGEKAPVVTNEEQQATWEEIQRRIHPDVYGVRVLPLYRRRWVWGTAVAVVFALGWTWWWFAVYKSPERVYQNLVAQVGTPLKEWVNNSGHAQTITLQDGSSVILQPGTRLSYPAAFATDKREVYLSGEALFEVAKNPQQPFFVYSNELITKVLGTSFQVSAYPKDRNVVVKVLTGRVSVFAQSDARVKAKASSRELEGVVLSPNQQITYSRENVRLTKSLVNDPAVLSNPTPALPRFVFRNTPVTSVFRTIEKSYGVTMVYDEDILKNCQLTADLTDEPLFRKLEIICKSIEARYQILDAQIVVTGNGCTSTAE